MGPARHALAIALSYTGQVVLATLGQTALVLGPPLLLAAVMQPVALKSERWTRRAAGDRAHWVAAGWIATALHELGHAALAVLFGHRVTHVKWFDFHAEDGALGRVDHEYDPTSVYQRVGRFFIGLGPVLVGVAILALGSRFLLGVHPSAAGPITHAQGPVALGVATRSLAAQLAGSVRDAGRIAEALRPERWQTWLFLYAAYLGGSATRLSASDLRSVGAGMATLGGLLLAVNGLTLWAGAFATTLALRAAGALALCDAALLAAIALQAAVGGSALALTHGAAYLRARAAVLAGS